MIGRTRRKQVGNRLRPVAAPRAATKHASPLLGVGFTGWREQHLYSLFSSLGRLAARPWATTLTVLVMGLALALPLLFAVLLDNAHMFSGGWQDARDVTVFLKPDIASTTAEALAEKLRMRTDVAAVRYKTPEEGLAEFRQMSGFAEALDVLQYNPLPNVLVVTPREIAGAEAPPVLLAAQAEPDVDLVQYDAAWRRRLSAILGLAERGVGVLAALLAVGALLVIGNTIRLDIDARREEIEIMQLVGANDGFVQRPFLYAGIWYGLLGGAVALAVVFAVELALAGPAGRLLDSYQHRFVLEGIAPRLVLAIPLVSAALGWFGALLATTRHLAGGRPA